MFRYYIGVLKGIFLLTLGLFLSVSCLSYHPRDASLNTASGFLGNWLGTPGAFCADILWQSFGWMTPIFCLFFCVWGFFLLFPVRFFKLRFYLFFPAFILGCWAFAATNLVSLRWTVGGPGGFVGFYLNEWYSISNNYILLASFLLCSILIIFSFKIPAFKFMSWITQKTFYALQNVSLRLPEVKSVKISKEEHKPKKEKVSSNKQQSRKTVLPSQKVSKASYELPSIALLAPVKSSGSVGISKETMAQVSSELEEVLLQFGIKGRIVRAHPGPVVTLYAFEPAAGVKTSRVIALADDIAREMRALSVRIALVPGSNTIGIEMPNAKRDTVYIREMIENVKFQANSGVLPLILGKDIGGTPVYADLAKMPHLLVAGTTGSGKSVAINTMILSLLYRFTPAECRMIMVDPKMLELSVYNGIPHLLTPVVTDAGKAVVALKWAVREMEDRYRAMSQLGVRNIDGYNQKLVQAQQDGHILTRRVQTGFNSESGEPIIEEQTLDLTPLPYIVVIVDEMADLMMLAGKDVEAAIQRLAQMARAAGIHLILATQRPSVDVITGTIKSNFPTRMSFQVTSKIDSRTILGESGAEQLLGKGDMLFMPAGQKPARIHGPFVSDSEIEAVVKHVSSQGEPHYLEAVLTEASSVSSDKTALSEGGFSDNKDLYDQAVAIILRDKKVSTSYIQRQLRIGYNKAADLIDKMESEGIISKPNVAGKREILVPTDNA